MKHHERRAAAAFPYFKLAVWDERAFAFRDGKVAFESEAEARREAERKAGKYRLSVVTDSGRKDLESFMV